VSLCSPIPPIRKADRSWAKSDLEKSENFAEQLSQMFTPHNSKYHQNNDENEKFLDAPYQMSLPIKAFSLKEVRKVIEKINQHKAPGYDLITGEILRQLP
jgi:hypothetical protein